ncbi:MAG: Gingipain precursor [Planctomycetota bacterium]
MLSPKTALRKLASVLCVTLAVLLINAPLAHGEHPQTGKPGNSKRPVLLVRPSGWETALNAWKDYRSSEYTFVEIDSKPRAAELQSEILRVAKGLQSPPAAILLCSDVAIEVSPKRFEILTPGVVLNTAIRLGEMTTDELCTDALYGDLDADGCPDIAVGRIPAKSPEELQRMLGRSIEYEAIGPGPWNDTVHVTAGVGGFGFLADAAIETVTRRFLSEGIPQHYHLNVTVASCTSTYCPDPLALRDVYIDRINEEGGLFWVYIGHGNVVELDRFQVGQEWLPIGLPSDTAKFNCSRRPPIALMLACFTGAFDARVDSFSEHLLAQPNGPIAVIAGSRVTMPYGLSQLASEMINGCFRDRLPTLGEVVLQAKRRIWIDDESNPDTQTPASPSTQARPSTTASDLASATSAQDPQIVDIRQRYRKIVTEMANALNPSNHDLTLERREHVRLMNLLGDPLLKIAYPQPMELNVQEKIIAGESLKVSGSSPIDGKLIVELALVRDRLPDGVAALASYRGTDQERQQMNQTYAMSNQLVVERTEIAVKAGKFSIDIPIRAEARGRYVLSTYVYGQDSWGVASKKLTVQRPK